MTNRWFTLFVLLFPPFLFPETRFTSPQGSYEVGFDPQEKRFYAMPSVRALPSGAREQIYRVSFYTPKSGTAIAETYFSDIQIDPKGPFPQKLAELARGITWSPNEDFCILPLEAWPQNPRQPAYRQAVAVRNSNRWQNVPFILNDSPLIWTSPLTVAGNASTECRDVVSIFDGKVGRVQSIEPGDASGGYRIIQADKNQVVMQRTAPHCGNVDFKINPNDCVIYDLRFERRQLSACP